MPFSLVSKFSVFTTIVLFSKFNPQLIIGPSSILSPKKANTESTSISFNSFLSFSITTFSIFLLPMKSLG